MNLSSRVTKILVPSAAIALALACSANGVQTGGDDDDDGGSTSSTSSSTSSSGTIDSGAKKDAGTSSSSSSSSGGDDASTQKDSSTIKDSSTTPDTFVAMCPRTPTAAEYASRSKPPIAGGNCTVTEINTFGTDLSNPNNQTWGDVRTLVKTHVSANCASCLFTDEASATWGAIVYKTSDPTQIIPNWGACLQRYAGAPAACATAYQQYWQCGSLSCDSCTPQANQDQCFTDGYDPGGFCEGAPKTAMNNACGAALSFYESDCDGQAQDAVELLFNHAASLCAQ